MDAPWLRYTEQGSNRLGARQLKCGRWPRKLVGTGRRVRSKREGNVMGCLGHLCDKYPGDYLKGGRIYCGLVF